MSKSEEYSQLSEDTSSVEMRGSEDATSDVLVDDYKDMKIDMVASSRKNSLQWNGLED